MSQASSASSTASSEPEASTQLDRALRDALDPQLAKALDRVLDAARRTGAVVYVVGGVPRDLLLGRCPSGSLAEVDLTVTEGHAELVAAWPLADGRLVVHPRFGTRSWSDGRVRLDLVEARAESYPRPGALPTVRRGSLSEDLARRDFSVNAMAWGLSGADALRLSDPHGGERDLVEGRLRVLHPGSFLDDPTRVWRGLRYARRLGFHFAPLTEALIADCLPVMAGLSGRRLAAELGRVWSEPEPALLLEDLEARGALAAIDPRLRSSEEGSRAAVAALSAGADPDGATAAYLLDQASSVRLAAAVRLDLPGRLRHALERCGPVLDAFVADAVTDAELLRLDHLGPTGLDLLSWASKGGGPGRRPLAETLRRQQAAPFIDGDALLGRGLRPGPELGRILAALRSGQLRGDIASPAAALRSLAALTGGAGRRILAAGGSTDA